MAAAAATVAPASRSINVRGYGFPDAQLRI
jgi:hypothetical protein